MVFIVMLMIILFLVGTVIVLAIKLHNLNSERMYDKEIEEEAEEYEGHTLTEEDENKIVAYALKQLKYNQNELHISDYNPFNKDTVSERSWRYYAFLDDVSIVYCINGVIRWESDSELSLLSDCAEEFLKGEDFNPFTRIKIELRTFDDKDKVEVEDWPTIEKFVDILYDTYYKMTFHQFVSLIRKEKERMDKFTKQRKVELYKKVVIDKN